MKSKRIYVCPWCGEYMDSIKAEYFNCMVCLRDDQTKFSNMTAIELERIGSYIECNWPRLITDDWQPAW